MKSVLQTIALSCALLSSFSLAAQCISDDCGDIFADWAILNESIAVCEGVTFEVENQTSFPNIDFYVWDWGNGERDTVYEVSNYYYTYEFSDDYACAINSNLIVFNISLEIYRTCEAGQSCHTQIAPVAVRLRPRASFDAPEVICAGDTTQLLNGTCGSGDYLWIFEDGTTSTDTNPSHAFEASGAQEVTLIVTNECGTDTVVQSVQVAEKPLAQAGIDESASIYSCGATIVSFSNESEDADYYFWDFPSQSGYRFLNGTTPTSPEPMVQFVNSGTYTVYMTAGNACSESHWQTTIEVIASPIVELDAIPTACDSTTVALMDYAHILGTYETLNWDITGPTAVDIPTGENPVVSFPEPGRYTIALEATSADCPNGQATTTLEIQAAGSLELSAPAVDAICTGSSSFTLNASLAGGVWSGTGIHPQTGLFDPATAGAGSHELQYTVNNSACQEAASLTLNVLASEQAAISGPLSACEAGSPLQLTASPAGGTWSGTGISDPNLGLFDPTQAGVGSATINYTVVNENNCVLETQAEAVVQPLPLIDMLDNYEVCTSQDNLLLNELFNPTMSPAGGSMSWSGEGVTDASSGSFVHNSEAGTYSLRMAYALNGCITEADVALEVIEPEAPSLAPQLILCESETAVQLEASPLGGVWSGPGVDPLSGIINPTELGVGDYAYTYTLAGDTDCAVSAATQVEVWNTEVVEAGADQIFCPDLASVRLPDGFPLGGTWSGPGLNENGVVDLSTLDPAHSYVYEYELELDAANCVLSDQLRISFYPEPNLDVTLPETACLDAIVNLLVEPEPGVSYSWHFTNGEIYTGPAVQYVFDEAGPAEVNLIATSANGCVSAASTEVVIATPPQAIMVPSVSSGCEPLGVAFANNSEGNIDEFWWDFGNGQTSTDAVPPFQEFSAQPFTNTVYTVTLVSRNACGEDRATQEIVVKPNELRAFFNANTTSGCAPLEIEFQGYAADDTHLTWNFGDGFTAAGTGATHTFVEPGIYTVWQVADNGCDVDSTELAIQVLGEPAVELSHADEICPDTPVEFMVIGDDIQTVEWDFGDGQTSTSTSPNHQYTQAGVYTITLAVNESTAGCPGMITSEIEVMERPMVTIAANTDNGCPPLDVCFTAEGEGASYFEWSFGTEDGNNSLNPCYTFEQSGVQPVTLRGVNEAGCKSVLDTLKIRVYDKPDAQILTTEEVYCGFPQEVQFRSGSSDAMAHRWTFSNNLQSEQTAPRVTFDEAGTFGITLQVENTFGCTDIVQEIVEVKPKPLADFGAFYNDSCVPQDVLFDNYSTGADSYEWHFGDDRRSTESSPLLVFDQAGNYDITLIVGHDGVCYDTLTLHQAVALQARPEAAFSWDTPSTDYEGLVKFHNESLNAISYLWDFGDGNNSTEVDPLHDYQVNGNWIASLLAKAANGCTDTAFVELSPELIYGLHFPNAFSPETGQGEVRVFKPAGLGLESWELEIFSPWGERVFRSEDLIGDQPGVAWDGQYKGKILPQGAYAYKASVRFLNGVRKLYTGSVTLLR